MYGLLMDTLQITILPFIICIKSFSGKARALFVIKTQELIVPNVFKANK